MQNSSFAATSLVGLFRELTSDIKTFIRQETELAKNETLEKVSCFGRNAVTLAIGGVIAYAGLMVFLGGIGFLIAFAFERLGIHPFLAVFAGLGIMGLLVIIAGGVMVLKGVKAISKGSLAPEKTIATIKSFKGSHTTTATSAPKVETPKRPPQEIQEDVFATEERISEEMEEIAYRTSPTGIKDRTVKNMRAHPYAWSGAGLGVGLMGTLLVWWRVRRA
ncbi:MAG TPA: phage holin family protein [Verrucomicrobiae bacterium]|nr:phage holin family protein [Verrucomicrobiae bacterium]